MDLVDEVDTKDQINVPLISFEESFPLEKEDSVEEVKPLVETAP